jgi:mRNA deadenylase 3'-5' endonuclease subunit Ccr4
MLKQGKEPEFTNFAWSAFNTSEAFIGTLDYIFLSNHWTVKSVDGLVDRGEVNDEGFPNEAQPSDHIQIGADITF